MAAVENLRSLVVDPLEAGLGEEWTVIGYPDVPTRPSGRTVAVWTTDLRRLPEAPGGAYAATLMVAVLTDSQDPRKADDDLDPALLEVLDVLWRAPNVVVESAERTTRENTHGWDITVRTAFVPDLTPDPDPEA